LREIVLDPNTKELAIIRPYPYPAYLDNPDGAYIIGLILSDGSVKWSGYGSISGYFGHIPIWKEALAKVIPFTSVSENLIGNYGIVAWTNVTLARTIIRDPLRRFNWIKMHPIIYKYPEHFVGGIWDGDGTIIFRPKVKCADIVIRMQSSTILEETVRCLRLIGIGAKVTYGARSYIRIHKHNYYAFATKVKMRYPEKIREAKHIAEVYVHP